MPSKDLTFRLLGEDVSGSSAMKHLADQADKSSKGIQNSFGPLPGLVALGALAAAGASVKMAGDYQAATTQLVTGAGESEGSLAMVRKGLLDMAPAVGIGPTALAKAMFLVESAGFHGAGGLEVMKAAAEGAKVGGADATVVANGLTTAMTDYNIPTSKAAETTSKLVATVAAGKSNMQDLSGALSAVLPSAAAAHIGLDQVLGSLATMTGEGISAQQSAQDLSSTIASLSNPTSVQTKAMAQMGLSSIDVAQNLGKRGLTGTFDDLSQSILTHMGPAGLVLQSSFNQSKIAAASAHEMLAKLPPSLQTLGKEFLNNQITQKQWTASLKGQDVLTSNLGKEFAVTAKTANGFSESLRTGGGSAKTFNAMMADMTGGQTGLQTALAVTGAHTATFNANVKTISGTTAEAGGHVKGWGETQKDFNTQMAQASAMVQVMAIKLGTALMPAIQAIVHAGMGLVSMFAANPPVMFAVIGALTLFGGVLAAAYIQQKLLTEGSVLFRAAALISTAAQWAWNAAMTANPIGIIIVAIAALVAGLVWFFTQTKLGQAIWTGFVKVLGDAWNWLWNSVINPVIKGIAAAWNWLYTTIIKPLIDLWVLEFKILEVIIYLLWTDVIMPVVNLIGAIFTWLYESVIKPVVTGISVVWNWLWTNVIQPVVNYIIGQVRAMAAIFTWLWQTVISPVANFIGNAMQIVGSAIGNVFGGIGSVIRGAFTGVVDFVRGIFNSVIDVVNGVIGSINGVLSAGKAIGINVSIPSLPHLASGGTLTRGGMAMVGENGPEVVRLPPGATVYPHGGMPANGGGGLHIEHFHAGSQSPAEIERELAWRARWAT